MKTTVKRRQGDQTPRWKAFCDGSLVGYAETEVAAQVLAAAFRDRHALQWALAAGGGLVSWDVAAINSGWRATEAYREHIRKLLPDPIKALAST